MAASQNSQAASPALEVMSCNEEYSLAEAFQAKLQKTPEGKPVLFSCGTHPYM